MHYLIKTAKRFNKSRFNDRWSLYSFKWTTFAIGFSRIFVAEFAWQDLLVILNLSGVYFPHNKLNEKLLIIYTKLKCQKQIEIFQY